jgi:hypothetical protein
VSLEKNFYQQLRKNTERPGVHLQRIESTTNPGIPDVNFCVRGTEGWLELKAWENMRRTGVFIVPKLRPEQVSWAYHRKMCGGNTLFLFRINQDVVLFDGFCGPDLIQRKYTWIDASHMCELWLTRPLDWGKLLDRLQRPAQKLEEFQEKRKIVTQSSEIKFVI